MRQASRFVLFATLLLVALKCGGPLGALDFDTSSTRLSTTADAGTTAVAFEVDNTNTIVGQGVFVVGEAPELGSWDPAHAVPLSAARYPTWTGLVVMSRHREVQFKFLIKDSAGNVVWEPGDNRHVAVPYSSRWDYVGVWGDAAHAGQGQLSGSSVSVHTTLGVPDVTTSSDPSNSSHYLSVKPQYVLSYDSASKVPNWVSWELNPTYLGFTSRANDFRPDDTLPPTMPQADLSDYSRSGFQRGHMCPSGDRTLDAADNDATFYLTNIVPQASNNNEGPWADLEDHLRYIAQGGQELYVLSGGIFDPDGGLSIGDGGVRVPTATWKVAAVLDTPGEGVASVSASTEVIAVIMPNDNANISRDAGWRDFRVTARQVEEQTGLDFFSDVPRNIQDVIENQLDTH